MNWYFGVQYGLVMYLCLCNTMDEMRVVLVYFIHIIH